MRAIHEEAQQDKGLEDQFQPIPKADHDHDSMFDEHTEDLESEEHVECDVEEADQTSCTPKSRSTVFIAFENRLSMSRRG
jgi:hypothetical protein